MDDTVSRDDLTATFEGQRTHLRAVAYRLLGSVHEADDAVQETWLRLQRSDVAEVDNLPAWLTTVVSRICLDQLRSRTARRGGPGGRPRVAGCQPAARRAGPGPRGRGRAGRRGRSRPARRPRHPRARRAAGFLPARSVRAVLRRDRDHPRPQQHRLPSAGQSGPASGARSGRGRRGGSGPAPRGGRGLPGRLPQRQVRSAGGAAAPRCGGGRRRRGRGHGIAGAAPGGRRGGAVLQRTRSRRPTHRARRLRRGPVVAAG